MFSYDVSARLPQELCIRHQPRFLPIVRSVHRCIHTMWITRTRPRPSGRAGSRYPPPPRRVARRLRRGNNDSSPRWFGHGTTMSTGGRPVRIFPGHGAKCVGRRPPRAPNPADRADGVRPQIARAGCCPLAWSASAPAAPARRARVGGSGKAPPSRFGCERPRGHAARKRSSSEAHLSAQHPPPGPPARVPPPHVDPGWPSHPSCPPPAWPPSPVGLSHGRRGRWHRGCRSSPSVGAPRSRPCAARAGGRAVVLSP